MDERSKQYSHAGDDRVNKVTEKSYSLSPFELIVFFLACFHIISPIQAITDIVRGSLCPAIQRLLEEGLRRYNPLAGAPHPWYRLSKVNIPTLVQVIKCQSSPLVQLIKSQYSPLLHLIKSQSSPLVQIILNLEAEKYFFARHFVVEACGEAVACDYNSVFSRLVLCKTFRLEEDGKVLMLIKIVFIEI